MIPWRIKNFISSKAPLVYHVLVNLRRRQNSTEDWDRKLAESWDSPGRQWPVKTRQILARTSSEDAILDVGCGTGSILRALQQQGYPHLHAIEGSQYAVDRLNASGIIARHARLPRIAFPDAQFDVVIASQVLEHIVQRRRFLNEIARVLKPGGRAFIYVPDNCLGPIDEPEHVAVYDERLLRRVLSRVFEVEAVTHMRDGLYNGAILFAQVRRLA